jgi:hypothetical protein
MAPTLKLMRPEARGDTSVASTNNEKVHFGILSDVDCSCVSGEGPAPGRAGRFIESGERNSAEECFAGYINFRSAMIIPDRPPQGR